MPSKIKINKLNSAGFSLVQVMLASGVMLMIGLGTIALLQNSALFQKNLRQNADLDLLANDIALNLNNMAQCAQSLNIAGLAGGVNSTITLGSLQVTQGNATQLLNQPWGSIMVTKAVVTITSYLGDDGTTTSYAGNLNLTVTKNPTNPNSTTPILGGMTLSRTLPATFFYSDANGAATGCFVSNLATSYVQDFCQNVLKGSMQTTWDPSTQKCIIKSTVQCQLNQMLGTDSAGNMVCVNTVCSGNNGPQNSVMHSLALFANTGRYPICFSSQ